MVFRGTSRWCGWGCPGKPFTGEKFARESLIILWMASHVVGSDLFPRERKNIKIISLQYRTGSWAQESLMTQRARMGWEAGSRGRDVCVLRADPHCCTADANTAL